MENFEILNPSEQGTIINSVLGIQKDNEKKVFGLQFHPEVSHTSFGKQMLSDFITECKIDRIYNVHHIRKSIIQNIKNTIKNDKVVMAVSGGVDSTVSAMLLQEAIGDNLFCVLCRVIRKK